MSIQARLSDRSRYIRKAALHLFKARGFAATTMRELAEAVGIEAASLYNHIDSKQGLLQDICFEMSNRYMHGLEGKLNNPVTDSISLRSMLERHLDIILQYTDDAAVAENEWRHLTEPARTEYRSNRKRYEDILRGRIEHAMSTKQIRALDATVVLYTVLASVQWIQRWYHTERKVDRKVLKEDILTMIFKGLETSGHG